MLPTTYDPQQWESALYADWEQAGAFRPEAGAAHLPTGGAPARRRFSICIAPPNVTGRLHIGHALENTVLDALVRWHRMRGAEVLWLPGTDHAGIATQAVVARRLGEEGTNYRNLGREGFLQRVWDWKAEYESAICDQVRRMGWSVDWSRLRFTMDPRLSRAVARVFVVYYRDGLLYRGERIVNWCPGCGTAISDIEVEHEDEPGTLYRVRYPVEGGGDLVIATVRPETMLGDTAVAVHPDDPRYQALVGRSATLPLVGRALPIIADPHVEPEFGTGALKVTPGHDADDFAIGQRHHLPAHTVIGTDARMTAEAAAYAGLPVAEARRRVVEDLRAQGYLVGEEPYTVAVGRCERCASVIEPLILKQWFVRVRPLVEPVLAALRAGELRIVPDRFARMLEQGLENEHDWCVSRQLWWGHRIPAWYCDACGEVTVAEEAPARCAHCGADAGALRQDPDVLDTWFSSALWPFSTLGWPEEAPDLARYYPTDLVVSGYDILLKWDMKMAWSGLRFTGRLPFRTVLLHGLVRDAQGRKMSKSTGNVVDPMDAVDRFGADPLRFALVTGVAPGNDTRFTWERVEGGQRFANKLWNAARLVLGQEPEAGALPDRDTTSGQALEDRYILSRLAACVGDVDHALEGFDVGAAAARIYDFVWSEFCDWYIEAVKPRLYGRVPDRGTALATLRHVLDASCRLLHPVMPFVTDAIWRQIPGAGPTVMLAGWPAAAHRDPEAEAAFGEVMDVVAAIRSLRAEQGLEPGARVRVGLDGVLPPGGEALARDLARAERIQAGRPEGKVVSAVTPSGATVYLGVAEADVAAQRQRLEKELASAAAEVEHTATRLANPQFRARARPEVVAQQEERARMLAAKVDGLRQRLEELA